LRETKAEDASEGLDRKLNIQHKKDVGEKDNRGD
jgi:hypothetical protein